ncbi:flavodoxin [uncultured Propionibacterium sp.]|uniref:flavodoxin n=1 Tax=uncultured Propionibacterium sp. TaxID=218066 RepID=UPI0029318E72|nr:flavodoxin [uncultured Propionibacterium sp.]
MGRGLVVYFSVYGSTRRAAQTVAARAGAELAEIRPAVPYDDDPRHYESLLSEVKNEHARQVRPELARTIAVADHDPVFLGYPLWDSTLPMPVFSFLEEYELSDRTIAPFNTHMGGADAGTYATIAEWTPGATVLPGLPIQSDAARAGPVEAVVEWLTGLGLP